jgi:hypothetical protein
MTRPLDYMAIPDTYCRWLGGLQWSENREAVEYKSRYRADSRTFVLAAEVALFLEGFQSEATPVCFGFILHLLHLLGLGARGVGLANARRVDRLVRAFRELGGPLRNAGVLCASLCRGLPRAADAPRFVDLFMPLNRGPRLPRIVPDEFAEVPPLEPAAFEVRILEALALLSDDDLRHWLRHGRGPVGTAGESAAILVPPSLSTTLADLERRPRLAGAAPLIAPLAGALALPPRRLAHAEEPTGGYADVATRGLPEQILPGQFALDPEEFLRRFAERELLYFHREEPHAPAAEELVVVVDQGVRTWGDVRLVLAAAALALGRQAARRNLPLRVATTSNEGAIVPAEVADREALGGLLEMSDLSPHPARALQHVLDTRSEALRDIVLLTHPRSLAEPEVVAAARQVVRGTRLFAVAVDGEGRVELSELRQGTPVTLGRCRAEVREPSPAATTGPVTPAAPPWRGDVEPIGFPFRIGPIGRIDDRLFTFDDSGEWVLAAGQLGVLNAWRSDGSDAEMFPRAIVEREPLTWVEAVLGVAGGFVVAGRTEHNLVLAHYDLPARRVTAHLIDPPFWGPKREWTYLQSHHTVVATRPGTPMVLGTIDLGVDRREAVFRPESPSPSASTRARSAALLAREQDPPHPTIVSEGIPMPARGRALRLSAEAGTLDIQNEMGLWRSCRPLSDGRPVLKGGRILQARSGGDVIGAIVGFSAAHRSLFLFSARTAEALGSFGVGLDVKDFAIAPDGRRFARRIADRHLEIRNVSGGTLPLFVTPKGKAHNRLDVGVGETYLTIQTGKHAHLVDWERGPVRFTLSQGEAGNLVTRLLLPVAVRRTIQAVSKADRVSYDGRRFVTAGTAFGLKVLVDALSQVTVLDLVDDSVVCMFYVFRDQIAAWMPDGTRVGPVPIVGGRSTPDALERIGEAIRTAAERGKGRLA